MVNFEGQYEEFHLNDRLAKDFSKFETEWALENKAKEPYSIITVINNDVGLNKIQEENKDAQLA